MFELATLIPDVLESLRTHLRDGIPADGVTDAIPGLNQVQFLVRESSGPGDPGVSAPAEVVFPDDDDPGVPIVRLTVESIELPEDAFDQGDEIIVKWRVIADCLAATKTGSRTANVSAGSAEALLASAVFRLLATFKAYQALEERGINEPRPRIGGLMSRDLVFRYPLALSFDTLATV